MYAYGWGVIAWRERVTSTKPTDSAGMNAVPVHEGSLRVLPRPEAARILENVGLPCNEVDAIWSATELTARERAERAAREEEDWAH